MGLMINFVLPVAAESQNAIVRSDPAQLEVIAGQIATLSVVLSDAQNVYGIDVSATFDPQMVEVVDVNPAKDGVQATPGAFPKPDFVARNIADNQAGTLHYAITQVNPTEPVNGSGVVFSVQFRAKVPSGQGTFTITSVDLTDRDGIALGVQPESGTIRIVPVGQTSPTAPVPIATPTATLAATPILATATPTYPPSPTPIVTNAPPVSTSTPTTPLAPVIPTNTPAQPTALSPSPEVPVRQSIVPLTDTPTGPAQPAAILSDSAAPDAIAPATPTAQAFAAAESPVTAEPMIAPTEVPVNSSTVAQADSDAERVAPAENRPSILARRQSRGEDTNTERATSGDPNQVLLIVGVVALAVAAITAILLVVIVRR